MTLINLKTVMTKTATVTSAKLAIPADRIGLGFDAGTPNPTGSLSLYPANETGSRQEQSSEQMRKQMHEGMPPVVPPASLAGCLSLPGSSAVAVSWRVTVTDPSPNRFPKDRVVRLRLGSDCQSPDRSADTKASLRREVVSAATAGK